MSPRNYPENESINVSVMSETAETGDDGFVFVHYNGDAGSENEHDETAVISDDPNCQQIAQGYSLLSQDDGQQHYSSEESDEENSDEHCGGQTLPDESRAETACQDNNIDQDKDSNNPDNEDSSTSFSSLVMTKDDEDLVKQAMSGFSLPAGNIPPWANAIPEDEWMKSLTLDILKR